MDQDKISIFITNLRKKHNLTQAQMAKKLNVTPQAISKWENGRGIPDIELLKSISDIFNVNINDILNGKEMKNKEYNYLFYLIPIFIIIISLVKLINANKDNFHFISLSSNNTSFTLKGVAAYSNDKKSIYITDIKYNEDATDEVYFMLECALYESINNIDSKITNCNINYSKEEDELKLFEELLAEIELQVDNYESACKEVATNDLYLFINVLDINNKSFSHKIPIKIEDSCHE